MGGKLDEGLCCCKSYEMSDFENAGFRNLNGNDLFVVNVEAISRAYMLVDSFRQFSDFTPGQILHSSLDCSPHMSDSPPILPVVVC